MLRIVSGIVARPGFAQVAGWIALVGVIVLLAGVGSPFQIYVAGVAIIFAISALGLDWIQGRAGQVSIGSAAFMAIGAFITAAAATADLPVVVALVLSALGGALVGFVVGLPALRLRGLYLALSTLALHFITAAGAIQYENMARQEAGFAIPPGTIGGLELRPGREVLLILGGVLVVLILGLQNIYRRAPGRAWLTIKESQMAAAVIGLNPTKWKLLAFVCSSALISFSGSLLAYYTFRASGETFSLPFAISFVAMIIVGGQGSIPGVLLGAALVTTSPYFLSGLTAMLPNNLPIAFWLTNNIYFINIGLYGVLVLAFLLYQPLGIAGALAAGGQRILRRAERRAIVGFGETPRAPQPAPRDTEDAPLAITGLRIVYRTGACAVDGIDLAVGAGEVVALLGRNGAGKTSTLRAISGFFATEGVHLEGALRFCGNEIRGFSPVETSRRGVVLVPEREKVFPNLTVAEHLRLVDAPQAMLQEIVELFPPLRTRAASLAGLLSGGERQMLALGMAFCMNPKLLLIDELSLGLAPAVIKRLMAAVRLLQERTRVPILLVEQNVAAALEIADRAYVLEAGRVVRSGSTGEITPEVVATSSLGGR